ncbi:MAG: hypothetical protein A2X94_13670 [Bdellovibrionales bacterium GWB1_55_8]|nr:MAG: hypothetical protein A2X94_13670 [Bdellovibrionales bacterium GWB1_55_8]
MLMLKLNKRMSKWNTILVLSAFAVSAPAFAAEPVKGKDCLDLERMLKKIAAAPKSIVATIDIKGLEEANLHPRLKAEAITQNATASRKVPLGEGIVWKQNGCRSVTLISDSDSQHFEFEMKILAFTPKSLKLEALDQERENMEVVQTGPGSAISKYSQTFDRSITVCGQDISGKAKFHVIEQLNWGKNPKEPESSFHLVELLVSNQRYLLDQLNLAPH